MTSDDRMLFRQGWGGCKVKRASCPVDDVPVWFADVGEALYAIVATARDDCWIFGWVGHAGPICRGHPNPCERTNGGLM